MIAFTCNVRIIEIDVRMKLELEFVTVACICVRIHYKFAIFQLELIQSNTFICGQHSTILSSKRFLFLFLKH